MPMQRPALAIESAPCGMCPAHDALSSARMQFEKAHEYTRALNAAKIDRIFAKPFVAALPHDDGVTALCRSPRTINSLVSGSADGLVRVWDVAQKRTLRRLVGHTGAVRGLSFAPDGETVVSCGADCTVKLWKVPYAPLEAGQVEAEQQAVLEFQVWLRLSMN